MSTRVSESLRKLVQGTAFVAVGNLLGMGFGFATRSISARYLGPDEYGLIVLGLTVLNVVSMVSLLGLTQGVSRQLPRVERESSLFRSAVQVSLGLSLGISIVIVAFSTDIATILSSTDFVPVLVLFALVIPLWTVTRVVIATFRGKSDATARVAIQNLSRQGLALLFVTAAIGFGVGIDEIAVGFATAVGISFVGGLLLLRTRYPDLLDLRSFGRFDTDQIASLISFSVPLMISGTIWLLLRQSDTFLVAYFLTTGELGVYDAAFLLGQLVTVPLSASAFLFLPIFSELHAENGSNEMAEFYKLVTKWISVMTLPVALGFITFPGTLLELFFGDGFGAGSTVLIVLTGGFLTSAVLGLNGISLVAAGFTRLVMAGNLIAFVLNIGLNVALIPRLGIVGAATASFFGYVVVNLFFTYFLYTRLGFHPLSPPLVRSFAAIVACYGIGWFVVGRHLVGSPVAVLPFLGVVAVFQLAVIPVVGGVQPEDTDVIEQLDEKLPVNLGPLVTRLDGFVED